MDTAVSLPAGAHDDIPSERYHAAVSTLSSSGLKELLRSPAHFRLWLSRRDALTEATRFGIHAHRLLLEPHLPAPVVKPKFDRRTKIGKADAEAWDAEHGDRDWIDADYMDRLANCVAAVRAHPGASLLLSDGVAERSLVWDENGIRCRARMDWCRDDDGIVDLKSTGDAGKVGFARSIHKFGYAVSAAWYWRGFRAVYGRDPSYWAWIAAESDEPYGVACYTAGEATLRTGAILVERALATFRACVAANRWPAYPDGIEEIDLPRYALLEEV